MKGHVELTNNWFRIYRDKWASIIKVVLYGAFCITAGLVMLLLQIEDNSVFLQAFGSVFLLVGLVILFNYPFYRRTITHGGDIAIEANPEGISISPVMNARLKFFPWESITRIVLVNKGNTDDFDQSIAPGISGIATNKIFTSETRQRSLIIFYLNPNKAWDRKDTKKGSLNYIYMSPEGSHYTYAQYPESHVDMIVSSLRQFSKEMVDIKSWCTVLFNYGSGKEEYSS